MSEQHSWANRRVRAIRAGVAPEPLPEPAQPWDEHAGKPGHFAEYMDGIGYCNTCDVQLVKPVVQDTEAKLAAAEASINALTPAQLVALLARMRPDEG